MTRIVLGDECASEELVRRHAGAMLAVAIRLLRCEHDAADAVQAAFVSAFRSIDRFNGQSRLATWLHRITVNACLMKLRAEKRRATVPIESLLPTFDASGHHVSRLAAWNPPPPEQLQSAELRAQVRTCIAALPGPYREVLLLRDIEQLDTRQTAEQLGINAAAAKVRLHRARQALRTLLERVFRSDGPVVATALSA